MSPQISPETLDRTDSCSSLSQRVLATEARTGVAMHAVLSPEFQAQGLIDILDIANTEGTIDLALTAKQELALARTRTVDEFLTVLAGYLSIDHTGRTYRPISRLLHHAIGHEVTISLPVVGSHS